MDSIYLDHNSTTPIDARVADAMIGCYRSGFVNPASQHKLGQAARRLIEGHRTRVLEILGGKTGGMDADRLVFTSGGTESNNLAVLGLVDWAETKPRVLISSVEHPSILGAGEKLRSDGADVELIPVDSVGRIRLDLLREMLDSPADLVSVMLANNETGVIQPIREAAAICRERKVLIHTDAVQATGKIPVDWPERYWWSCSSTWTDADPADVRRISTIGYPPGDRRRRPRGWFVDCTRNLC
jgi:cysteine desulfurase